MSYEEERSQIDFDDVVRQNQQKYKEETKLSNQQVGRRSFKSFLGKNNIFDKRFLTTSLERRERTDPTSASFSLGQKVRTKLHGRRILLCVIFI